MSVYDREYIARFARATSLTREAIEQRDKFRESWAPWAFRTLRDEPIPVRLSHDKTDAGIVGELGTRFNDDTWHYAVFKLDPSRPQAAAALERIKVGCPVSMSHCDTSRDQWATDANAGISRTTHAYLTELSILNPTHERPGIEGAQIVQIREPAKPVQLDELNARLAGLGFPTLKPSPRAPSRTNSPAPRTSASDGLGVGEIIHGGQTITRYFTPPKITIR